MVPGWSPARYDVDQVPPAVPPGDTAERQLTARREGPVSTAGPGHAGNIGACDVWPPARGPSTWQRRLAGAGREPGNRRSANRVRWTRRTASSGKILPGARLAGRGRRVFLPCFRVTSPARFPRGPCLAGSPACGSLRGRPGGAPHAPGPAPDESSSGELDVRAGHPCLVRQAAFTAAWQAKNPQSPATPLRLPCQKSR